jgi:hypothetical protein
VPTGPIHYTKEPYRNMIWAICWRNIQGKRVCESPKHCTKELGTSVTVHTHDLCTALTRALSRWMDHDVMRLTDGTWWPGGALGHPVEAPSSACAADHTAPPCRGCGGRTECSARRSPTSTASAVVGHPLPRGRYAPPAWCGCWCAGRSGGGTPLAPCGCGGRRGRKGPVLLQRLECPDPDTIGHPAPRDSRGFDRLE